MNKINLYHYNNISSNKKCKYKNKNNKCVQLNSNYNKKRKISIKINNCNISNNKKAQIQ